MCTYHSVRGWGSGLQHANLGGDSAALAGRRAESGGRGLEELPLGRPATVLEPLYRGRRFRKGSGSSNPVSRGFDLMVGEVGTAPGTWWFGDEGGEMVGVRVLERGLFA